MVSVNGKMDHIVFLTVVVFHNALVLVHVCFHYCITVKVGCRSFIKMQKKSHYISNCYT